MRQQNESRSKHVLYWALLVPRLAPRQWQCTPRYFFCDLWLFLEMLYRDEILNFSCMSAITRGIFWQINPENACASSIFLPYFLRQFRSNLRCTLLPTTGDVKNLLFLPFLLATIILLASASFFYVLGDDTIGRTCASGCSFLSTWPSRQMCAVLCPWDQRKHALAMARSVNNKTESGSFKEEALS